MRNYDTVDDLIANMMYIEKIYNGCEEMEEMKKKLKNLNREFENIRAKQIKLLELFNLK